MTIPDEKTRRDAIERALREAEAKPDRDRRPLTWQDRRQMFDVIRLPLDMVVLNPNSHRISSQLEAASASERQAVETDPHGAQAQAVITEIIHQTDGYPDVLQEMRDVGQEEPGVVSRSGVLINANTRVVALREIDPQNYVDLMVLPPDPDPKDIMKLELKLQEKRDVKQPYTFTNSLKFLKDLKNAGYSDADAARDLRIDKDPKRAVEEVQRRLRIFALIREIQKRSEGAIPLPAFDDLRVALEECDRDYEGLRKSNAAGAELVKEARIAAMLTGVQYRNIRRFASPEKVEDHVIPALVDPEFVEGPIREAIEKVLENDEEEQELPGLDDLEDRDEEGDAANLAALVDVLARSYERESVTLPTASGTVSTSWDEMKETVAQALDYASENAKAATDAQKSLDGPTQQLREARTKVNSALAAYRKVAKAHGFKSGKFDYELRHLIQAIEAVRAELDKHNGKR